MRMHKLNVLMMLCSEHIISLPAQRTAQMPYRITSMFKIVIFIKYDLLGFRTIYIVLVCI